MASKSYYSSYFLLLLPVLCSIVCSVHGSTVAPCVSGYQWSSAIANTNVFGGIGNAATTVEACKAACVANGNCIGIDWASNNAAGSQCYFILTTTTGTRNNGTATGVTHYDYTYVSCNSGCSYVFSSAYANTNVLGGTGSTAATLDACKAACIATANCNGIDWVAANSAGSQCFIIVSTSAGQRNNGTATGVTHYDYLLSCSSSCYQWSAAIANTNVQGGTVNGATSVDACKAVCVSTTNCIGVDWNSLSSVGQQCYIILSTLAGQRNSGIATGITHYDYNISANCNQGCGYTWSGAIANTNVLGGSANAAASIDACKAACLANANCTGIDWVPGNSAGSQCYLTLTTSTGPRNNGTATGVTHYDYIYSCSSSTGVISSTVATAYSGSSSTGCVSGYVWSAAYANTNVLGGTANAAAATLDACKAACLATTNCNGIDWVPSGSAGLQCFVIVSTSAGQRNNGTATGVTHYDYYYSSCSQGCGNAWSGAIANTNVANGLVNPASSADACKTACLANANCIGIDWAPGNAASSQCYLTLTTTTGPRNNGTAMGVTHYDYIYSCNGCGYAWSSAIANTNVANGIVNGATSADACKAACLANGNCIGIDWAPGNSVSSQCYFILTTTTGLRNNGTATGVTHYDYIYSCSSSTGGTGAAAAVTGSTGLVSGSP